MESYSALIPVRNGLTFLSRLKSYFESQQMDFEIVIIDDDSTDGTANFLNAWKKEEQRLKVLRNPGRGIVSALNAGLKETNSDWVFRFDVDDVYSTDRITSQLKEIKKPNIVASFCDYSIIGEGNENLGFIPTAVDPVATYVSLISASRVPHPGAMLRRSALMDTGGYHEEDLPCEDLGMWLRLKKVGELYTIPKQLLTWRLSCNSLTGSQQIEMSKKKHELLSALFDSRLVCRSMSRDVDRILNSYDAYEYADQRKFLFLLDLLKVRKFCKEPLISETTKIFRHLISARNLRTFNVLLHEKVNRDQYRRSFSKSNRCQFESSGGE